jgi:tRNA U55 pseudouridine synthase TruB
MTALRRTRCGAFTIAQATSIDHLDQARIIPLAEATRLPVVVAPDELVAKIRSGLQLPVEAFGLTTSEAETFQLVASGQVLVAIGHAHAGRVIYDRVFATPEGA